MRVPLFCPVVIVVSFSQSEVSLALSASLLNFPSAPEGVSPAPPAQSGRGYLILQLSSQKEFII